MPSQHYLSQRTNPWTKVARMRTYLLLFLLLICAIWAISTSALTTVSKQLHFEWDYDISLPGLAGYIIYQNDQPLITINDPKLLTLDLSVELEPGQTVVFTMKAFDVNGNESVISAPYAIDVPLEVADNLLPTASLNLATESGAAPLVVDFFAVGSTDPDGTIVSYAWDFGDGASATTSTASHTYTVAGIYTVTLTVTDNDGGVGTAQKTVTVEATLLPNIPPTASVDLSTGSGEAPLAVEFSAEGSTDSDGTIVSYGWDFGDGASASTSTASHTYIIAGVYTVTLTVTDNTGATATAQGTVTCTSSTPALGLVSLPFHFEWDYDVNLPGLAGYILYQNDQRLLTINDPKILTIDYAVEVEPGKTVVFTMKAFDIDGNESAISASYSLVVPDSTILLPNIPPTASLNLSTGSGEAPLAVEFSAEGSTDSDGTIVSYGWDFGDGAYANTSATSHTYTIAGVYTVTLTVTDNVGATDTAQGTVTVSAPAANIPPTASLNLSTGSGEVPLTVEFSAEGSTDPDGTIVSYVWDFGDDTSAATSTASHTYTIAGVYTVTLTVTDNVGATATAQSTVTCASSTTPALGLVSLPFHFEWEYDVNLPGLAGYILYQNDQRLLTINDPKILTIDYAVEVEPGQTVVFTMKAFDIDGNESAISASYSLVVPLSVPPENILPTASLNLSTGSGEVPLAVEFSAEGSTDPDGTIVSYVWDFGDDTSAATSTASHIYTIAGVYTVTLTVTDNVGATDTAQSTVTVSAPPANILPTALFSPTPTSGTAPLVVGFDGTLSSDADGTITSYFWDFGDGSSTTGVKVSHTYTAAGSFTAELTVTDDKGGQATYKEVITVNAAIVAPVSPVASISFTPQLPNSKDYVQFSGADSTPAGNIIRYLWDFGDGKSASGVTASHKYRVGTYTVKLTVWDNYDASNQTSVVLTVTK